jgi:ABC-type transport system involved in cytochrome bd biosynthesis fused ATPase/permease subunit
MKSRKRIGFVHYYYYVGGSSVSVSCLMWRLFVANFVDKERDLFSLDDPTASLEIRNAIQIAGKLYEE